MTTCAGGLDAEYPVTEYVYYGASDPMTKRGRLASVTRYAGGSNCAGALTTTYGKYTEEGAVATVEDPNGVRTQFQYTGKLVTKKTVNSGTGGLNLVTEYGYEGGKLAWVKHPQGNYTVYCRRAGTTTSCTGGTLTDKLQWVAKAGSATGGSMSERIAYEYWPTGELKSETRYIAGDSNPRDKKSYTPDLHARPAWEAAGGLSGAVLTTKRAFDGANNVVGLGLAYHPNGSGIQDAPDYCRLADGGVSPLCARFEYDRADRLTTADFDADGIGATTSDATRTCFDYDEVGNIRRVSAGCAIDSQPCASHNTGSVPGTSCTLANTEYDVDDFGDVVEVRFPWSNLGTAHGVTRYAHDARGNVTAKQTEVMRTNNEWQEFTYDLLDRPTGVFSVPQGGAPLALHYFSYDETPSWTIFGCPAVYNLKGRLALRKDSTGRTWYSYDNAGRTVAEYNSSNPGPSPTCFGHAFYSTLYSYTPNSNLASITYPHGRVVEFIYGGRGPPDGLTDRVTSVRATSLGPSGPGPARTLLKDIKWEPFGGLRYYQQSDYVSGAYRYRAVEYARGSDVTTVPSANCATSMSVTATTDGSGRLRQLSVSDGGVALGAPTGNIMRTAYAWQADMLHDEQTCFTALGQSGAPFRRTYRYDNLQRLTQVTGAAMPVHTGQSHSRSYGFDGRGNRTSVSLDGTSWPTVMGSGRRVDHLLELYPSIGGGYEYEYDEDGRVVKGKARQAMWEQDFEYGDGPGDGGVIPTQGGLDTVYKSVTTTDPGVSTVEYYYDARNRLWLRILPAGHEERRFYDLNDNVLTMASPLAGDATQLVFDDFVWLDGKLVATIRGGFDEEGYGFEEVESPECNRVGSTGTCGVTHIVNDYLPKPVLAIHGATSRVTGAALYDEGGNINRVPFTPAFSAWSGGTVGQVTLPVPGQVEQRVLFGKLAWPNTTINGIAGPSAGFINPHSGNAHCWSNRVWSNWGNASGSITVTVPALPEIAFNCSGVFLEAAEYRMRQPGATYYFPALRFPGQYADSETELHSNWNRFYDPLSWRYRQSEPLLHDVEWVRHQAKNGYEVPAYSYARNNPIFFIDPSGLQGTCGPGGVRCATTASGEVSEAGWGVLAGTGAAAAGAASAGAGSDSRDKPFRIPIPLPCAEDSSDDCDKRRKSIVDVCKDRYLERGLGTLLARFICEVCTKSSYEQCRGNGPDKFSEMVCEELMKKYGGFP